MTKFWLSKAFWINVIVVAIMVIQYVMDWPNNPMNWLFAEGIALAVLNYILNQIQQVTIKALKLENKTLKIQMKQAMGNQSSD
jgi:hypothetical protein